MDERKRRRGLIDLLSIFVLLYSLWVMIPKHRQQELKMKMALNGQKLTERAARRVARVAMADELKDRQKEAQLGYEAAYSLMTGPRERLGRLYDKLRGA